MTHLPSLPHIIGLTGSNASGKGAAANFFKDQGYVFYSLSDVLREHLKQQQIGESRLAFIKIGTELRQLHGVDVLAAEVQKKIANSKHTNFIIDSFRHPSEVVLFKRFYPEFKLLCIAAPSKLRFERAQKRGRSENANDLAQFIENEKLESSSNTQAQQLQATLNIADAHIENSTSMQDLYKQLKPFLLQSI